MTWPQHDDEVPEDFEPDVGAALVGASWSPVDLRPYLDGTAVRPVPSVGIVRTDGLHLLYAGKEHSVIGEMESGKSWLALQCAAAELLAGNHVVYVHFEEADPTDTVERLQALGVSDDVIRDRFIFVGPNEPVDKFALAALLDPAPSLVILDGINEALSLHGLSARDEDGIAEFRRTLVKPCTAVGAAVLGCDHVVKDEERRGRVAMGSIHKGNALSGSLILLENAAPFGRGERGCSHVFVTKDRPGHLRRHGRANGKTPGKTFMGSIVVDDTRTKVGYLDLVFIEPPEDDDGKGPKVTQSDLDDDAVVEVVAEIESKGARPNLRSVRAMAGKRKIGKDRCEAAIVRAVMDERLIEQPGPNRARLFFTATDSQSSEDGSR